MDFAAIILEQMERLGLNVNQAEVTRGFPQGYIRGVVRDDDKRAAPNVDKAERIARALGLEFYVGPTVPRDPGFAEPSGSNIFRLDRLMAVGAGKLQIALPQEWFIERGTTSTEVDILQVQGDWMVPTIPNSAVAMYDTTQTDPPPGGEDIHRPRAPIYVCILDGKHLICRVERPSSTHYMLSFDNQGHAATLRKVPEVGILGKVVWWGHAPRE